MVHWGDPVAEASCRWELMARRMVVVAGVEAAGPVLPWGLRQVGEAGPERRQDLEWVQPCSEEDHPAKGESYLKEVAVEEEGYPSYLEVVVAVVAYLDRFLEEEAVAAASRIRFG